MNIPGFTAETSLYKTSGHYQTGRYAINLPTQMISAMYPAAINTGVNCNTCVGGECAELHCFENWTHGGGGSGGPYEGGGGGGPFGGGGGTGTRKGCVDAHGDILRHGTTVVTTVVLPGGGVENTYVLRQRCNNGRLDDVPY